MVGEVLLRDPEATRRKPARAMTGSMWLGSVPVQMVNCEKAPRLTAAESNSSRISGVVASQSTILLPRPGSLRSVRSTR